MQKEEHFLYYTDFLPVFVCIASRILKPSKKLLICSINCFPKRLTIDPILVDKIKARILGGKFHDIVRKTADIILLFVIIYLYF